MPETVNAQGVRERTQTPLASYCDEDGAQRTVLAIDGAQGTILVIDRRADACADIRLVAHLDASEPRSNAQLIAEMYVADEERRGHCALMSLEDLHAGASRPRVPEVSPAKVLTDRRGVGYQLAVVASRQGGQPPRELRWTRFTPEHPRHRACSLRDVVGALEAYEPVYAMTLAAIARYQGEPGRPALGRLQAELKRLEESRYVLNRGLREAVVKATERGLLSMSQIAARCGHFHEGHTEGSGDTSWLQRRIGLMKESEEADPSPWVDQAVLGRIARDGLGVDPASVEL